MQGTACSCAHHKIVPLMIILIGLAFLLQAFGVVSGMIVSFVWPALLIIAGVGKLKGRDCPCCGN